MAKQQKAGVIGSTGVCQRVAALIDHTGYRGGGKDGGLRESIHRIPALAYVSISDNSVMSARGLIVSVVDGRGVNQSQ